MIGNVTEWCSGWFDVDETLRPKKGGDLHMSGEGHGVGYTRVASATSANWMNCVRIACAIP